MEGGVFRGEGFMKINSLLSMNTLLLVGGGNPIKEAQEEIFPRREKLR